MAGIVSIKVSVVKLEKTHQRQFSEVAKIIRDGRRCAFTAIDTALMDTYWNVGKYISQKRENAEWGEGVVESLASYLGHNIQDIKGFSNKNLWRMKKFYEIIVVKKKTSALNPL
jgi:precorrin-2 methylase